MAVCLACGGAAEPTEAPAPTAAPAATSAPAMSDADSDLQAVAAELAGGPGAIYAGDLSQLVGPVPEPIADDIGDYDGVPHEGLEDYLYVFDSDYYRQMIEQANLTNPTQATSTGLELTYQFACINRALTHCKIS